MHICQLTVPFSYWNIITQSENLLLSTDNRMSLSVVINNFPYSTTFYSNSFCRENFRCFSKLSKLFSEFQSPNLLQMNVHRINSNQEHPKLTDLMYKWHLFDGEIDEKLRKNKSTFPTEGCESKLFIVRRRELGVGMHKCYFAVDIDKLLLFNRTISNATRTNGFHTIV